MNQGNEHEHFMAIALEEAKLAGSRDEVPVGAVIVRCGEVLCRVGNRTREINSPTRHAEMIAIENASLILGSERLSGCDLYVTKEPCSMCAGAIVHSRIRTLVIGARDVRYGACGTVLSVCGNRLLNHVPQILFGVLEEECSELLKKFFQRKRLK